MSVCSLLAACKLLIFLFFVYYYYAPNTPSSLLMTSWSLKINSLDIHIVISQQFLIGLDLCLVLFVMSSKLVDQLLP